MCENLKSETIARPEYAKFISRDFFEKIYAISPIFIELYEQASIAESTCLYRVAGVEYRCSLEYLVRDFLRFVKHENAEAIENISLCQCINKYIDNSRIKKIATNLCGLDLVNNKENYLKIYNYENVNSLKLFITAILCYIYIEAITMD